jgi:hypothetical protein
MKTLEQVREQIRKNFPQGTGQRSRCAPITWNRETGTTIVSSCGRYRISRRYVKDEDTEGYFLSSCSPPKHISGPYLIPRDAREAAQAHANGEPLQADLA